MTRFKIVNTNVTSPYILPFPDLTKELLFLWPLECEVFQACHPWEIIYESKEKGNIRLKLQTYGKQQCPIHFIKVNSCGSR